MVSYKALNTYCESTFWGGFSSGNHRNFDKAYTEHKNAIKQQYASIIERLTT